MEKGVRRWMVDISLWDPGPDEFSSVFSLLPLHEHSNITRFIKFDDRRRALISRLLQYVLIHQVLEIPFDEIVIRRTIEGKPYLEACVKAIGADLGYGLDRLEFHHINCTDISIHVDGEESRAWRFWLFDLGKWHWASVATGPPNRAFESYRRRLEQVEEYYSSLKLPDSGFVLLIDQLISMTSRENNGWFKVERQQDLTTT